jgi:hypothetical protein
MKNFKISKFKPLEIKNLLKYQIRYFQGGDIPNSNTKPINMGDRKGASSSSYGQKSKGSIFDSPFNFDEKEDQKEMNQSGVEKEESQSNDISGGSSDLDKAYKKCDYGSKSTCPQRPSSQEGKDQFENTSPQNQNKRI